MTSLLQMQISRPLWGRLLLFGWRLFDRLLPKRSDYWAFFAHPLKPTQFVENSRAVFEQVKNDPVLHKLIFTRGTGVELRVEGACNVQVINLQSLYGLLMLARCGVYLLTNSIAMDVSWRWANGSFSVPKPSMSRRVVVNLWHGIPLKRLFALTSQQLQKSADRVAWRREERALYRGLVCSSDVDSYAMAAIFHPIDYHNLWITGLPRNDFLRMADDVLPNYLHGEVQAIRRLKKGRRLITYAPTYREADIEAAECYQFSIAEIDALRQLLRKHDAVLGFRMHYFRNSDRLFNLERYIDDDSIIDLGHAKISEVAAVLRESDLVITDYSSVYVDALYIDKPVISFAYDLEHYRARQNGLLYDMDMAFPGPVTPDFEGLLAALDDELAGPSQVASERYRMVKKMFFKFIDDSNAQRLVDRLQALTGRCRG